MTNICLNALYIEPARMEIVHPKRERENWSKKKTLQGSSSSHELNKVKLFFQLHILRKRNELNQL